MWFDDHINFILFIIHKVFVAVTRCWTVMAVGLALVFSRWSNQHVQTLDKTPTACTRMSFCTQKSRFQSSCPWKAQRGFTFTYLHFTCRKPIQLVNPWPDAFVFELIQSQALFRHGYENDRFTHLDCLPGRFTILLTNSYKLNRCSSTNVSMKYSPYRLVLPNDQHSYTEWL